MYTESPPLNGAYPEHDNDAPERNTSNRAHRLRPVASRPSSGFRNTPVASGRRSATRRIIRTPVRFLTAIVIGVGATLVWQSYGGEIVRAWIPSLGWLVPASPSAELQAQVKPLALDLAIMRRGVEQLASVQDQLARKQDQLTQAFATLQAAVRDINDNILTLAPLAPKGSHVPPPKPVQPAAQ